MNEHNDSRTDRPGRGFPRWILAIVIVAVAVGIYVLRPAAESGAGKDGTTESTLPRLVDLGADKCVPCKMMAPILEELRQEYAGRLQVDFFDVWKNPDIAKEYGIQSIPTQIFYDATGRELFRNPGYISKEDILAKWKELGVELASGQ